MPLCIYVQDFFIFSKIKWPPLPRGGLSSIHSGCSSVPSVVFQTCSVEERARLQQGGDFKGGK